MDLFDLSEEQIDEIYQILVDHAGAHGGELERLDFLLSMQEGCTEYRFIGKLGFGGKLRRNSSGLYVDCYAEDETQERLGIIYFTNDALSRLSERWRH